MADDVKPEAFDDAASDVASTIFGHYTNFGLSDVEREVFLSEVHLRLADILQQQDGEDSKAEGPIADRLMQDDEYDEWSEEQVVKGQPDYDPKTRSLKNPRAIEGKPLGLGKVPE
jgi:hypothetical protein